MGKQIRAKKPDNLGKGKVTPVQIAFIVDRYLSDNNYNQTRSIFRTEASSLLSKSQDREAPKSLLGLDAMLDEYICLKEQKVRLDQEKCRIEQEKCRVETLLQGMQNVMHAYNSGGTISPPPPPTTSISPVETKPMALVSQPNPNFHYSSGNPMNKTPTMNSILWLSQSSTPTTNPTSGNKRKGCKVVPDVAPSTKKSCNQMPTKLSPVTDTKIPSQANYDPSSTKAKVEQKVCVVQPTPHYRLPSVSLPQGSSVAKSLFKQPSSSPKTGSLGPNTPPQVSSPQPDKSISPLESASNVKPTNANSHQDIIPTSCPITSSKTVPSSPFKHVSYFTTERNHHVSSSPMKTPLKRLGKRDQVKGRLDFDSSNVSTSLDKAVAAEACTSGTVTEGNIFDTDMPNFDIFGPDFSLSQLLVDIDIDFDSEGSEPPVDPPTGPTDETKHENGDASFEPNQTYSELSSSVTEVLCEKSTNVEGSDSLATSMKSITKCIRILSPAKNRRSPSLDQENLSSKQ